jgi:hypothetical protein
MTFARQLLLLLWAGWLSLPLAAGPVQLRLGQSVDQVLAGDQLAVEVIVGGLGAGSAPSVGAFDLNLAYNQLTLSATNVVFGTGLGEPGLDALTGFDLGLPGWVNFASTSLLGSADLDALQPDPFVLATLHFEAIFSGAAGLGFVSDLRIDDAQGLKLPVDVPEPASLLLWGVAIAALGLSRRRLAALRQQR